MSEQNSFPKFTTKKCPECFTPLQLNAEKCTQCNQRVGEVSDIGIAKKPVDWKSYVSAVLAVAALGAFIWFFLVNH